MSERTDNVVIRKGGNCKHLKIRCDLLNKLNDENEQLKQYNTELINKIDFLERIIDGDV